MPVELPIGLEIADCVVCEANGQRWAGLPSKPQLEGGQQRLDPATAYAPILKWRDKKLRAASSDRIVALVVEHDPDAFGDVW